MPEVQEIFLETRLRAQVFRLAEHLQNANQLADDHWHTTASLHDYVQSLQKDREILIDVINKQSTSIRALQIACSKLNKRLVSLRRRDKIVLKVVKSHTKLSKRVDRLESDVRELTAKLEKLSII